MIIRSLLSSLARTPGVGPGLVPTGGKWTRGLIHGVYGSQEGTLSHRYGNFYTRYTAEELGLYKNQDLLKMSAAAREDLKKKLKEHAVFHFKLSMNNTICLVNDVGGRKIKDSTAGKLGYLVRCFVPSHGLLWGDEQ
uniref:Uncharacterized protein n=1 Tax=Rhodosorus marinus TaxID=101924 RepID=A0A7S2ZLY6_9RHOD|mmetsp:Transcript_23628/g.93315  ORF Transcript_23628/g.93315 Transcript_23628/m.93315 type:complete len:137 (+) Transcript_23628:101-511(+)